MSSGFFSDLRAAKQGLNVDDKGNVIKGDPWYLTSLITVHKKAILWPLGVILK